MGAGIIRLVFGGPCAPLFITTHRHARENNVLYLKGLWKVGQVRRDGSKAEANSPYSDLCQQKQTRRQDDFRLSGSNQPLLRHGDWDVRVVVNDLFTPLLMGRRSYGAGRGSRTKSRSCGTSDEGSRCPC